MSDLRNTPIGGSPPLTPSSFDPQLINIQVPGKAVYFGRASDIFQGFYGPARLKLAMKCLRCPDSGATQVAVSRRMYENEARIRSSLSHVNVQTFFRLVELSGNVFLVYRWAEHGDLSKFLTARLEYSSSSMVQEDIGCNRMRTLFLAFDEATTIHGIASGLQYLHAQNVVHGNLQASNILLDDSLKPLISGFGMARNAHSDLTLKDMQGVGMARWTCPSLADGSLRTKETDVFSLGMTIVEILTGRVPFPHMNCFRVQVAFAIGHRPSFTPAHQGGKDFIPLWKVAASCWNTNPMVRPGIVGIVNRMTQLDLAPDAPSLALSASPDLNPDSTPWPKSSPMSSILAQCVAAFTAPLSATRTSRPLNTFKNDHEDPNKARNCYSHDDGVKLAGTPTPRLRAVCLSSTFVKYRDNNRARPRISICTSNSHLISFLPPGKPINYGNCDLYRGYYCDGSRETALAMKRLRVLGDAAAQAEMIQKRAEREAGIWHDLDHVNILPFYGKIEISSETYLVSPWIERGDLAKFMIHRLRYLDSPVSQREPVPDATRSAFLDFDEGIIIHGIASGLEYLHGRHVIHGDLKATNVLLGDYMTPLICDFGTTKNDEFSATFEGMRCPGTARWKCPSLIDGSPRSEKTDIFAFGITIVEVTKRWCSHGLSTNTYCVWTGPNRSHPVPGTYGVHGDHGFCHRQKTTISAYVSQW
ncbi:hypothetical protein FRB93_007113 [Tulasnella sp. JGI-2019a]|nr:hypothetical protein FRB93_007113 [Tulasnella sp. JGI-2019a]